MVELINLKDDIESIYEIMDVIYDEWGKTFHSSKEEKIQQIKLLIEKDFAYPQMYVLKDNGEVIGSFTIRENDLEGSRFNPWLACVIIKKDKRGKGYGSVLLKYIEQVVKQLKIPSLYLTTLHTGFYEKIGFKFIKMMDKNGELNRLYKLSVFC